MNKPRVILHLVEKSFRGKYCAGNWKDIESFNHVIQELGRFELVEFENKKVDDLIKYCIEAGVTDVIVAYSFQPEILSKIKKTIPAARLYVRAHNAEAFQHWQRSEINFKPSYENLRSIYGSTRLAWRDSICKRNADGLLGISEWDNQHYWRWLPGKAELYNVPYSCPWPFIRPQVQSLDWVDRKKEIVCLAGGRDAIGRTMLQGFNQLADTLGQLKEFTNWKFSLSPGILQSDKQDAISNRVNRMETLDEPWDLLCSVRALAVLTPLGFGFKTTIVDALAAGCHVLVHPTLAKRLPSDIRSCSMEFNPEDRSQVVTVAQRLQHEPDAQRINQSLRDRASNELKRAFSLG